MKQEILLGSSSYTPEGPIESLKYENIRADIPEQSLLIKESLFNFISYHYSER